MSGLKLLNTVLPLSEAVVFRYDDSDSLNAVARFKGPVPDMHRTRAATPSGVKALSSANKPPRRENWSAKQFRVKTHRPSQYRLLHENETAGVLLIRLASEFSADDDAVATRGRRFAVRAQSRARKFHSESERARNRSVTFHKAAARESSTHSTC